MTRIHTLRRTSQDDQGTFGIFRLDTGVTFTSGELPWRDLNHDGFGDPSTSRITAGTYRCEWKLSSRYGYYRYALQGVKGREGILIHGGNFVGDKTKKIVVAGRERNLKCDIFGCILLGMKAGILEGQRALIESRKALEAFEKEMAKQPFTLVITDAF